MAKNKFVHISGGKNNFWRKIDLYTLLRKGTFFFRKGCQKDYFLTKNKFVHTSEKGGPLFPKKCNICPNTSGEERDNFLHFLAKSNFKKDR